ncbi:SDR family NAD(P)-dependent oxidoreductase [Vulgatibacter incomptus]|uniref:UDP-glucose 4-epimerase n=1 Tax=Vulgatibacter incomptus TaxID=1391653 RepID=A0A0K1PBX8_9BACT|nr:SDR family NAD(P)-dependent oxidoreductase [Vulgatibacter incomptus]AKU91030.1 UDP-glucose 4-epimerase [Vulgatibacter incomptus]
MKKVLVTGGAGFIGSHVADELIAAGHEVTVLDNLSSGKREQVPARARFVEADIRSREAADLIRAERFDALVHQAAQIDVRRSVSEPGYDAEVNLIGMLNLLQAAAEAGVGRVLFASSGGACYGEQEVYPAPETHPSRPVSPYGVSKAAGELYLGYYAAEKKLSYCALRYSNVYGPRQDPLGEAGVVAIFAGRCLADRPCTIYGDGRQTRDYVYVGDVARANRLALESDYVGALNVGTGRETDVIELHRQIAAAAGFPQAPTFGEARPGEQRRSCIDPSLAKRVLGWEPEVTLEEGIARTAAFFRAQIAA